MSNTGPSRPKVKRENVDARPRAKVKEENVDARPRAKPKHPPMSRKALMAGALAALVAIVVGVVFIDKKPVGKPGTERMDEYANTPLATKAIGGGVKADVYAPRDCAVYWMVKDGNITTSSKKLTTISATGKSGSVAKFEAMFHAIRVGNDESFFMLPQNGAFSQATCKELDLDLPTKWMSKHIRIQAFEGGGKVWFIAEPEILAHLGERTQANDRDWSLRGLGRHKGPKEMRTPRIIRARGELFMKLLAKLLADEKIDPTRLISGHLKEVIQDPGQAAKDLLATYPACGGKEPAKDWRTLDNLGCILVASKHPNPYHDYSHGVRCVKPEITVDKEAMSMEDFFGSKFYAKEFGFVAYEMPEFAYKVSPRLKKCLEERPAPPPSASTSASAAPKTGG